MMSQQKRVLMVVTNCDRIDDTHPTGIWFEEFAIPYMEFKSNGFEVTVASPKGGVAPLDPRSTETEEVSNWTEAQEALQHTQALASVEAADFDAVFLPGGHGTMFDLPDSADLHKLLSAFAEADKVIAAVCHGPAGFVGAKLADGTPLVAGKTITGFTNDEERAVELDQLMPFLLETRLRELGGQFVVQPNWSDHIEQDGKLITGQNPQSSKSAAQAVVSALNPVTTGVS
ncbi:MAG: type 1 glutamine amidotransferase domain-containing protein [Microcoleus sp. SIO2G3]|nr:type 1 glutamine amidotransferase domain-containing protein [Microcoleus sp. SIO2G3]